jgi:hypothetical protein
MVPVGFTCGCMHLALLWVHAVSQECAAAGGALVCSVDCCRAVLHQPDPKHIVAASTVLLAWLIVISLVMCYVNPLQGEQSWCQHCTAAC